MQTTKKTLRRRQLESFAKEHKHSKLDGIKILLFILTILGILLTLLGYGYDLGIASTFGYSPLEIVNNGTDFLYDSSTPMMLIYAKVLKWTFWKGLFLSNYYIRLVIGCTLGLLVVFTFVKFVRSSPKRHDATRDWIDSTEKSTDYFERAVFDDGIVKGFFRVVIMTPFYMYLGSLLIFICVFLLLTVIFMVPILGYTEGKKVAKDYVVDATGCVQLRTKNKKVETDKKANCVALVQDEKEIARGRVIAQNSERIFLYVREYRVNDKQEKEEIMVPKSYPIRDAIIERVDTEDFTKPSSSDS